MSPPKHPTYFRCGHARAGNTGKGSTRGNGSRSPDFCLACRKRQQREWRAKNQGATYRADLRSTLDLSGDQAVALYRLEKERHAARKAHEHADLWARVKSAWSDEVERAVDDRSSRNRPADDPSGHPNT